MATDVDTRLTLIENKLNQIQTALNNVPTKVQLNSLTNIRQGEVIDLDTRVLALEGEVSSIPATINAEVSTAVPAEVATVVPSAVSTEIAKVVPVVVSDTIYVDVATGDDTNSGLSGSPVKTIQQAINMSVPLQTANPNSAVKIIVTPGIYNETIDIGNSALNALQFESAGGVKDRGPYVTNMISTTGLENLKQVIFTGFSFTNEVTLASDVDGTANKFGDEGIFFRYCEFDEFPGITIKNCINIYVDFSDIVKIVLIENVVGVFLRAGTDIVGGGDAKIPIKFDTGLPNPGTGSTCYFNMYGGVNVGAAPNLLPATIGIGNVSLNILGGNIMCGYPIEIGDGCRLLIDGGDALSYSHGTFGVNSQLWIRGGSIGDIRSWTFDPSCTLTIMADPYLPRDGDIHLSTDGNDVFNGSKTLPVRTMARAISLAAAYQQGTQTKPVIIHVAQGNYAGQSIVLEDSNLVDIHIKSEAIGDDPTYFDGLTSTTNNQGLERAIFEGIHFHAPVNLSCSVDGAANRFGHDGFLFRYVEFQADIYAQSLSNWDSYYTNYWGNTDFINCFYVGLEDGSATKMGGQYIHVYRDHLLPLCDSIALADSQSLSIRSKNVFFSTLELKTLNGATKTIRLKIQGYLSGTNLTLGAGVSCEVWQGGYCYASNPTNDGIINLWGGQFYNVENLPGTGSVSYWTQLHANSITAPEFRLTDEGGYAVYLLNGTGSPSIKGSIVELSNIPGQFVLSPADGSKVSGIVYENSVANGELCLVVVKGKADILLEDSTASVAGNWVRTSLTTPGRANATLASPTDALKQIGYALETKTAGTDVLCRCLLS